MALAKLPENNFPDKGKINDRVWRVLQELQHRQKILVEVKSLEFRWKFLLLGLCAGTMLAILIRASMYVRREVLPIWLYLLVLIIDCLVFVKLRRVQVLAQKAMVNYGVIRHHLLGMTEVGLCTCSFECDCKEKFKRQALESFGVNLY